ncbi:hypothetical protein C8R44DRAFT_550788, partial [Mycena epipterygia]
DICDVLQAKNIRLKEISAPATEALLRYLASYSGLQRVAFDYSDGDLLADSFFEEVLPRHKDCLRVLHCRAIYEGRWSLGPHNLQRIRQLRHLESIGMSFN